jgi:hypothetical protein
MYARDNESHEGGSTFFAYVRRDAHEMPSQHQLILRLVSSSDQAQGFGDAVKECDLRRPARFDCRTLDRSHVP